MSEDNTMPDEIWVDRMLEGDAKDYGLGDTKYIRADVANARIAAAEDTATQAIRVAVDLQGQLTAANKRIADLEHRQIAIVKRNHRRRGIAP